jgi:hypothetical protein
MTQMNVRENENAASLPADYILVVLRGDFFGTYLEPEGCSFGKLLFMHLYYNYIKSKAINICMNRCLRNSLKTN